MAGCTAAALQFRVPIAQRAPTAIRTGGSRSAIGVRSVGMGNQLDGGQTEF